MEIKTLGEASITSITEAFNEAFSDYAVNFSYTNQSFERKIAAENIKMEYCPAAFVDGKIVGFILNGLDEVEGQKRVFNGGTGVVPSQRGQRIVEKLYDYILPILKEKGYRHHQLEVLATNEKAVKAYEKAGFSKHKNIAAFKGTIAPYTADGIVLKSVAAIDWNIAKTFCDIEPAWQNSTEGILRFIDKLEIIAAYKNEVFVGYAVFDPVTKRTRQFAVKKEERNQGIGRALFSYVNNAIGEVSFTNYDQSDTKGVAYFKNLGLTEYFESYEMRLFY